MARFSPKLELLNDRVVPSCTWVDEGNVLTITGDSKSNDIVIEDDGTALTITCDGETVDVAARRHRRRHSRRATATTPSATR